MKVRDEMLLMALANKPNGFLSDPQTWRWVSDYDYCLILRRSGGDSPIRNESSFPRCVDVVLQLLVKGSMRHQAGEERRQEAIWKV